MRIWLGAEHQPRFPNRQNMPEKRNFDPRRKKLNKPPRKNQLCHCDKNLGNKPFTEDPYLSFTDIFRLCLSTGSLSLGRLTLKIRMSESSDFTMNFLAFSDCLP